MFQSSIKNRKLAIWHRCWNYSCSDISIILLTDKPNHTGDSDRAKTHIMTDYSLRPAAIKKKGVATKYLRSANTIDIQS